MATPHVKTQTEARSAVRTRTTLSVSRCRPRRRGDVALAGTTGCGGRVADHRPADQARQAMTLMCDAGERPIGGGDGGSLGTASGSPLRRRGSFTARAWVYCAKDEDCRSVPPWPGDLSRPGGCAARAGA